MKGKKKKVLKHMPMLQELDLSDNIFTDLDSLGKMVIYISSEKEEN